MVGVFEMATRHAIEEILRSHVHESKYGYVITKDSFEALGDEIFRFLQTSRELKSKGDRLLMKDAAQQPKQRY